jgi:endonuclease/exonuclease/phosphatase family metal-dependent hydrolase
VGRGRRATVAGRTVTQVPIEGSAAARPLRVMTYNISHGRGADRRVDLARIAGVIGAAGVDVAGLQEVDRHFSDRSGFVDQAGWLAGELGMHVTFGANIDLGPAVPGGPHRQFGNAILSVAPIDDWDNTLLPRSGDNEQRGLLRAAVTVRGVPWQVYTTHLQHDDARERQAQAEAIVQVIRRPHRGVVLLGDLNASPASTEVRTLAEILIDAWRVAHAGFGATFPSPFPYRRLDYVMRSPDGAVRSTSVVGSVRARLASDHLPVVGGLGPPDAPA